MAIMARHMASSALVLASLHASAEPAVTGTEQGTWSLLSRNFFLHNDFRHAPGAPQGYQREWAQGFIATLESGFTPGTVGLGIDAHGFLGIKLDGGRGHAGTGLLPHDSGGDNADDYADAGAAVKLRVGQSLLSYGEMTVQTPVLDTGDKRLQPEYATGVLLDSQEREGLRLQAGRFTRFKRQNGSSGHDDFAGYGATTEGAALGFAGATFAPGNGLGTAVYLAQLDDTWRQGYLNLNLAQGPWSLDGNLYKTLDQGRARAGAIDTLAYSLQARYAFSGQALSVAYQHIHGDTPFDFIGGDSIYLANSIKYADFNGPHERSWQLRYDLDLAAFAIPGLTFMARYVSGRNIDGSHAPAGGAYNPWDRSSDSYQPLQGKGGRHWERDLDLRYTFSAGVAKDLSLSVSHVSHRGNRAQGGDDIDRLYLVVEYPLNGWF
ncbi:OprD family porin [Pseudomonas sp. HLMP]|uniref:OprD family porin n=1 Tax=Pseudomonas sp. HLMP TaxID=3153767 RepID=UPI003967B1AD